MLLNIFVRLRSILRSALSVLLTEFLLLIVTTYLYVSIKTAVNHALIFERSMNNSVILLSAVDFACGRSSLKLWWGLSVCFPQVPLFISIPSPSWQLRWWRVELVMCHGHDVDFWHHNIGL